MRSGVSCVMAVSLVGPPGAPSIIHSQAATAATVPPSHLKFQSHPNTRLSVLRLNISGWASLDTHVASFLGFYPDPLTIWLPWPT